MVRVDIRVDRRQLRALRLALGDATRRLPNEMANAINKTATKTRTTVSKEVRKDLNVSAAGMKSVLRVGPVATKNRLGRTVFLDHEKRPGIGGPTKRFKPKHTGRGTSWRIEKGGKLQKNRHAFMGPKPHVLAPRLHGGVFVRTNPARSRSPIRKMYGISPWSFYLKNKNIDRRIRKITRAELRDQIDSRINTILKRNRLA